MRRFKLWASALLILAVAAAGVWALWNFELRWRPNTITRHQAQIVQLLQSAGWVSPGRKSKVLYIVTSPGCAACDRFTTEQLPDLQAAGIETRVIVVARRDLNGRVQSTPADRATVAQLWLTRDWRLLQTWQAAPAGAWKAPGVPPADGDLARMAVVEGARGMVDKLTPLLRANGVRFAYPTLVWWNAKGEMRACACQRPESDRFVRRELGI